MYRGKVHFGREEVFGERDRGLRAYRYISVPSQPRAVLLQMHYNAAPATVAFVRAPFPTYMTSGRFVRSSIVQFASQASSSFARHQLRRHVHRFPRRRKGPRLAPGRVTRRPRPSCPTAHLLVHKPSLEYPWSGARQPHPR